MKAPYDMGRGVKWNSTKQLTIQSSSSLLTTKSRQEYIYKRWNFLLFIYLLKTALGCKRYQLTLPACQNGHGAKDSLYKYQIQNKDQFLKVICRFMVFFWFLRVTFPKGNLQSYLKTSPLSCCKHTYFKF